MHVFFVLITHSDSLHIADGEDTVARPVTSSSNRAADVSPSLAKQTKPRTRTFRMMIRELREAGEGEKEEEVEEPKLEVVGKKIALKDQTGE